MSDFAGMEDLLQDFLVEAGDLLSGVDNKLVDLERAPDDKGLLNDIFRGFHTIKGGAGFLNATELVTLCHLTENLFDRLRNGEIAVTPDVMDSIMDATGTVRDMFCSLEQGMQPGPAAGQLLDNLRAAIAGQAAATAAPAAVAAAPAAPAAAAVPGSGPDWAALHGAVASEAATVVAAPAVMHTDVEGKSPEQIIQQAIGRRATDKPGAGG